MLFEPFTCNGCVLHGQRLVCVCMISVLDCDNQMVDLKSGLLCFEPYIGFKQSILNELFKEDDQVPVED